MSFDDHPADRQSYSHAGGFRGEEGIEDTLDVFWIYSGAGVLHRYRDAVRFRDAFDR